MVCMYTLILKLKKHKIWKNIAVFDIFFTLFVFVAWYSEEVFNKTGKSKVTRF